MDHIMLAILDHERGVKILLYTFIGVQFLELLFLSESPRIFRPSPL